ncbi:cupin domain-containing protein [Litoribrevibacter euphylliae]|uniref:Cupin domain-containing protein n=1 Tax=Litoribrevibacter euphylliae TaxID=1834034 RepID=A0ABV7HJC3_9GAMM
MAKLFKYQPETEFYTDEGCYITELSNSADDKDCSIALARVKPGVTTEVHQLIGTIERYTILEGEGRIMSGTLAGTLLSQKDTIVIPADEPQSIANESDQDLVFLCVCTPRFKPQNYRSTIDE